MMPRAVFCAIWLFVPVPALSQSIVTNGESLADVTLLAGRAEADGVRMAGLVINISPGWKTYWRNPGGVGIPPRFDWSRSGNLGAVEVLWPRPYFFDSFGLTTVGYSKQVVIPIRLVPEQPGQPIEVGLDLSLGICREVCVLQESAVTSRIEPGAPDADAAMVAAAEATVPRSGWEQGMTTAACRISGTGKKRLFEATLDFSRPLEDPVVLLEGPDLAWFKGIETTTEPDAGPDGSRLRVDAEMSLLDESVWVNRSQVRMTVLAGDFAADIQGCTAAAG
jgi:DsbC/DsbD-like thiol-disulfide interchange protein